MAGFVRRFSAFPTLEVLAEIEGVAIIDLVPAGVFVGRATGVLLLVGEWPGGPLNTPTEYEGDSTSRAFGGFSLSLTNPFSFSTVTGLFTHPFSNGNAYVWIKGKTFRRLILTRVDNTLAEGAAIRLQSSPSTAATGSITVPAGGGASLVNHETFTVPDGINNPTTFEFLSSGSVTPGNVAVPFTGGDNQATVAAAVLAAINGVGAGLRILAGAGGAGVTTLTNDFPGAHGNVTITDTVANAGFLVSGMSGGAGIYQLDSDFVMPAGTRIRNPGTPNQEFALAQKVVFAAGTRLDTAAFTAFDPTNLAKKYSTRTVSQIPVYSTRNVAEGSLVAVTTVDTNDFFRAGGGAGTLLPTLTAGASTGALDGSAANVAVLTPLSSAVYDARYQTALDASKPGGSEAVDNVELVACARESSAIRSALLAHAAASSAVSTGRVAIGRPPIGTVPAIATTSVDPGVGANRGDTFFYAYPHFEQRIPEIAELDPNAVISTPNVLVGADAALGTICSQIPPEWNPGQSTSEIIDGGILQFIRALEPNLTGANAPTAFNVDHYKAFKRTGIAALRRDGQIAEWIFQSGVTSVDPTVYPTRAPIKRRRMSFFIQDSLAAIAKKYNKKLKTIRRVDSMVGEFTDFLDTLLAEDAPEQQRIAAYGLDAGSDAALAGTGISVVVIDVQLLDDMGTIVLQTNIGETVEVVVRED